MESLQESAVSVFAFGRGIFLQEVFSPCVNHLIVLFTLFSRDEI